MRVDADLFAACFGVLEVFLDKAACLQRIKSAKAVHDVNRLRLGGCEQFQRSLQFAVADGGDGP